MGVDGGPGGFDLFGEKIKAFIEVGTLATTGHGTRLKLLSHEGCRGHLPVGKTILCKLSVS